MIPCHICLGINEDCCKSHVPTLLQKKKKNLLPPANSNIQGVLVILFTGFL